MSVLESIPNDHFNKSVQYIPVTNIWDRSASGTCSVVEIIALIRFVAYLRHQVSRKTIKLVVSSTDKAVRNHLTDVNTMSLFLSIL